jgi:hypothetical protein
MNNSAMMRKELRVMSIRKSSIHPMDEVNMIAMLADVKEELYKHSLMIDALTELLMEKGHLTADELQSRATQLNLLDHIPTRTGLSSN